MPLQKQKIAFSLAVGQDQKGDSKAIGDKFIDLQNVRFTKDGLIQKRMGFTSVDSPTTSAAAAIRLKTYKNQLIRVPSTQQGSPGFGTAVQAVKIFNVPEYIPAGQLGSPEDGANLITDIVAVTNGVLYASGNSLNQLYIIDPVTGTGTKPSPNLAYNQGLLFAFGDDPYIYNSYTSGSSFKIDRINTSATATSTTNLVTVAVTTGTAYDVTGQWGYPYRNASSTRYLFATYNTNATTQVLLKYDINANVTSSVSIAVSKLSDCCALGTSPFNASSTFASAVPIVVGWHNNVQGLRGGAYSLTNLAVSQAVTNIDATLTTPCERMSLLSGNGMTNYYAAVQVKSTTTTQSGYASFARTLYTYSIASGGLVGTNLNKYLGFGLASKLNFFGGSTSALFGLNNLVFGALLSFDTFGQKTYFLAAIQPFGGNILPQARTLYGLAGGVNTSFVLPNLSKVGNNLWVGGAKLAEVFSNPQLGYTSNVYTPCVINYTMDDYTGFYDAYFNNNLFVSGGFPTVFDGLQTTEVNHLLYPEIVNLSQTTTGGSLTAGTYLVSAAYRRLDSNGKYVWSGAAPTQAIAITAATSGNVLMQVSGNYMSLNPNFTQVWGFISQQNGTVLYQDWSNSSGAVNTSSALINLSPQSGVLGLSQPDLYTTGNAFSNDSADGCNTLALVGNRLFIDVPQDLNTFQFSQLQPANEALAFADENTLVLPGSLPGPITAFAGMDDKTVIFKERAIFYMTGDGPDNTGNGAFSDIYLWQPDLGCYNQGAIQLIPAGLIFAGPKGIWLLSRQMELIYIGKEVETIALSGPPSNCKLKADTNEVVFLYPNYNGGVLAKYNYYFKQWSYDTVPANDIAVDANGALYVAGSMSATNTGPQIAKEGATFYDNIFNTSTSSPITVSLQTPYFRVNGIQGFQRIYQTDLIGNYSSTHQLNISVDYDYVNSYTESHTANGYLFYNGSGPYQAQLNHSQQKCSAFSLIIKDSNQNGTGESFQLNEIEMTVGIEPGLARLPKTKKF